jgi:hypothetical protein
MIFFFYISANPCKIDKQIGPCNGPFQTKYYYDQVTKQCKSFQWGGCQPNANNFPSLAACQRQCPSTISTYKNKYIILIFVMEIHYIGIPLNTKLTG